jgi:predicted alpha/beta-hydrolase family hydrolase
MRIRPLRLYGPGAIVTLCAVFIGVVAFGSNPRADTISIETRPGGAFELSIFPADGAKAVILMFEGSGGIFDPGSKGFVNAHHEKFVDAGFTVAVLNPPADRRGFRGGMSPRFRESKLHAKDIGFSIRKLKQRFNTPVWLLGISMGTKSVAMFAAIRPKRIDGVIFLSSSIRPPGGYKAVTDYDFSALYAPLLAVAHEDDGCKGTPPQGAEEIVRLATGSKNSKTLKFTGGYNIGRSPCGPGTPHTFAGIEDEVVSAIAAFIREHSP